MALFLYAREHSDGHEAVADIGHFTAHRHERDRGITSRSAREWALQARVLFAVLDANSRVDGDRLPPDTKDYLRIAASRIGPTHFKRTAGISFSRARSSLSSLSDRLTKNADGTWKLPTNITEDELAAFRCAFSVIVAKSAFEPETLVTGFLNILKSAELLSKDEIREHWRKLSEIIQLFAISVMHNATVCMSDGTRLPIDAVANVQHKEIQVLCSVLVSPEGKNVSAASAMFVAKLDPSEHCHSDLLGSNGMITDVELSRDGKLVPL